MTLKLNEDPTTTRVQTRDGRDAVILDYCGDQPFPLIGKVKVKSNEWVSESWNPNGTALHYPDESDLVNAPRTWWVNVMEHSDGQTPIVDTPFTSREEADERASFYSWLTRIACVQVTEGEGLDEPEPEPDYVLDRNERKVRVGDLISVSILDEDKVIRVKVKENSVVFQNSEGVLREIPAKDIVLVNSKHAGGADV